MTQRRVFRALLIAGLVALAVSLAISAVDTAFAQEVPTEGEGPGFPSADDIGNAIVGSIGQSLQEAIGTGLNRWLFGNDYATGASAGSGQQAVVRLLGFVFGSLVRAVNDWVGSSTAAPNGSILTQLPLSMTTGEVWVRNGWDLFARAANAFLLGAFVVSLLAAGFGNLTGFMWAEAKMAVVGVFIASVLIRRGYGMIEWVISTANQFSASWADPMGALPGWRDLSEAQQASGEGLGMLLLIGAGVLMALSRWMALMTVNICIIAAPIAFVCMVTPGLGGIWQRWRYVFLAAALIQIPQAIAIGQGQALVSQWGAGASGSALLAGLAALILAWRLPKMIPGFSGGGSALGTATQVATLAKAFGPTAAAGAPAGQAVAREVMQNVQGSYGRGDGTIYGSGPTIYRSAPLLPRPLAPLPPPNPYKPVVDVQPLSVE